MTNENPAPEGEPSVAAAARELLFALTVADDGCTDGGLGPGFQNGHGEEVGTRIAAARASLRAALAAPAPRENNSMGQAGCFPAGEKTTAALDVERLIRECLPGGRSCDPQAVADSIREWAQRPQTKEPTNG